MAFVNEYIPEEEKQKLSFPVFTSPDGSKPTLWKWTIDRERDALLVCIDVKGGGYEGTPITRLFVLIWKGYLITFSADPLGTSRVPAGVVMSWRVHELDIPSALQNRQEELLHLIKDAFTSMGDIYDGEKYVAVNVNFDLSFSR